MQIHISPRDVKLTPAIHSYVAQKLEHLDHYFDHIIGAHVAIAHDQSKANKHAFVVKVHLAVPGPDLHAEDQGHELYAAIDAVTDKLAQQIRKRKTGLTKKRVSDSRKAKAKRQSAGL